MKSKMINFKQLSLMAALALSVWSCTEKLDVKPVTTLPTEEALKTENDITGVLIGCYDGMQGAAVYGGDIMVLNDLTGNKEDIRFTGTFAGLNDAYNASMNATNSFARDTWAASYNTINRTNNVLANLDKVTTSEVKRKRMEGEALFIRASLFFELVRLYAKAPGDGDINANPGVPLVLTPTSTINESSYVSRATVKQVYDKVIADLNAAETLLPSSNSRYATKWAAAAQLSRVHLMLGNYAEARDAANRVITGSGKTLASEFSGLWFTEIALGGIAPAEYIFWTEVTLQDGTNSLNTYFGRTIGAIPGTAGRSDCKIQSAHLAKYEPGDARRYFILSGGNNYTRKHLDRYGDVPIIRLAEMYLTRAEANQRLGTAIGATPLDDVNTIRTRAKLPALTTVTLDQILKERYLETAFEGHNLHEKKRLKQDLGSIPWNSPTLIFPIPQREIDVNKNLTQNEGY
jgi:hypothetical protein